MGLFEKLFGGRPKEKQDSYETFRLLNGYTPHFSSFGGSVYEYRSQNEDHNYSKEGIGCNRLQELGKRNHGFVAFLSAGEKKIPMNVCP